jgi:hypothetical protein
MAVLPGYGKNLQVTSYGKNRFLPKLIFKYRIVTGSFGAITGQFTMITSIPAVLIKQSFPII